jgi:hypothetical protein
VYREPICPRKGSNGDGSYPNWEFMVHVRGFCNSQEALETEMGGLGTFLKPHSVIWNYMPKLPENLKIEKSSQTV